MKPAAEELWRSEIIASTSSFLILESRSLIPDRTEELWRSEIIASTFSFLILESRALSSTAHSGISDLW